MSHQPRHSGKNEPASDVAANTEIELKLLCPPEQLSGLEIAPSVARYARDAGKRSDLTAIYYDTPDLDLMKSDSTLRVRSDGTRFVMTFKAASRDSSNPLERQEWEAPVSGMEPDLAALAPLLSEDIFALLDRAPLRPVFATEVKRDTRILDTPRGTIELAIDHGLIVAGERSEAISEIELELVEGRTEALFLFARELMADFALHPSLRPKSARGFDLALGKAPEIAKAPKFRFDDDVTLERALEQILRTAFRHLLGNQPAAEKGSEPEGLHQYRVALRRLRSVLGVIRSVTPSAELDGFLDEAKQLIAGLNDARDWDVFITETLPPISERCPSVDGFQALESAAVKHRNVAYEKARGAITDPRTGRFQISLGLWIEQKGWRTDATPKALESLSAPAHGFATKALKGLYRKALNRGRHFRTLSPEERHRLRIALKKLRYAADFLLPLFAKGKDGRRYMETLADLQDHLGRYNDMAVTERLVHEIMESEVPAQIHGAAGTVLGWQARSLLDDDARLLSAWKAFRDNDLV